MAENSNNGAEDQESGAPDQLNNLKQEFNRKLGNFDSKISQLEQTNAALLQQLQSITMPKAQVAAPGKSLNDVWLDSPEEAANMVSNATEARIMSKLDARAKESSTIQALANDFPEITDPNHELTKKAVEIYGSLSAEDKKSPVAYRAAVREAAMELNMVPKSKREQYEDDVSIRGTGNSRVRGEQRKERASKDIDAETEEFARLVGVNIDDPKTRERIKSKHGRRTYNRWE